MSLLVPSKDIVFDRHEDIRWVGDATIDCRPLYLEWAAQLSSIELMVGAG